MIPVPQRIIRELGNHIYKLCLKAESGWEFSNQDEDTITGDFLSTFRTDWLTTEDYQWRFYYNKIRGRGPNAMESIYGTDGIITLSYEHNGSIFYKSLVFQAKKKGSPNNIDQEEKMERYFPKGNIKFIYGSNGYFATGGGYNNIRICKLLITEFLNCKIGIVDLYYDSGSNSFIKNDVALSNATVKDQLIMEVIK